MVLRLDYGGLGRFCSTHANMELFSFFDIPIRVIYMIRLTKMSVNS